MQRIILYLWGVEDDKQEIPLQEGKNRNGCESCGSVCDQILYLRRLLIENKGI